MENNNEIQWFRLGCSLPELTSQGADRVRHAPVNADIIRIPVLIQSRSGSVQRGFRTYRAGIGSWSWETVARDPPDGIVQWAFPSDV